MANEIDLNGKSILVTGGTGSFGQAFVRHVISNYKPRKLIIYSRDEAKQVDMEAQYGLREYPFLRYFIGDVRDVSRLEMAMNNSVDVVVHTAALKHVPVAEYNPFECINTNIHGTENVIRAAIRNGVRRVMALSTDKAVNPINLYGATKLAAEKLIVAANNLSGDSGARFAVCRYGNVVGSRGSVVPFFDRLIREGATELPITDERMTRFWIRLEDGVKFVLTSLQMMEGGEIFVPKLEGTRVMDVAEAMAPKLKRNIVGIRPGEKIHEWLLSPDEARMTYDVGDRYVVQPAMTFWQEAPPARTGTPLPADYLYSSDREDLLMPMDTLRELIGSVTPHR